MRRGLKPKQPRGSIAPGLFDAADCAADEHEGDDTFLTYRPPSGLAKKSFADFFACAYPPSILLFGKMLYLKSLKDQAFQTAVY